MVCPFSFGACDGPPVDQRPRSVVPPFPRAFHYVAWRPFDSAVLLGPEREIRKETQGSEQATAPSSRPLSLGACACSSGHGVRGAGCRGLWVPSMMGVLIACAFFCFRFRRDRGRKCLSLASSGGEALRRGGDWRPGGDWVPASCGDVGWDRGCVQGVRVRRG
jgi:hypothetical protein